MQSKRLSRPLPQSTAPPVQPAGVGPAAGRWPSAQLFGELREIEIEHRGAVYRLRITALGKLILTK